MTEGLRKTALEKLAFFGPADVYGSPAFTHPPFSVGQALDDVRAMGAIGRLPSGLARGIADDIVSTGVDVSKPVGSLLKAGLGALAGNFIATQLGLGPFARGAATTIGAGYGYRM